MFEKIWSHESITDSIKEMEARGKPIYSSYVHEHYPTLHRAAFRYFGNWETAVTAAGFNYDDIRRTKRWSRDKIVEQIKKAHAEGTDLSWRAASTGKISALAYAAICDRHFGSWGKALRAAGLNEDDIRRYHRWDEREIQHKILTAYSRKADLNAKAAEDRDPLLFHAAVRTYGSWRGALQSCGLDYHSIALRSHLSGDEVLNALRDLQAKGVHMSSSHVQHYFPAVHASAVRRFGTWRRARLHLDGTDRDLRFRQPMLHFEQTTAAARESDHTEAM